MTVRREAAFRKFESRKVCETATLILAEPLRLRHLPYPRYRAAEEDIARLPNFAVFKLFPTSPFSQPLPATSLNRAIQLLYLLRIHFQQHTFTENTPYRSNHKRGHCSAASTATIKVRKPCHKPTTLNPQQKKSAPTKAGAPLTR
mgnify:CR=1 FL=1